VFLARALPRKPRYSCVADDERTSAWEGRSVYHGLSVRRLTRGEAKGAREAKRGGAEPRAGPRDADGNCDEDLLAHSPGQSVARVCEYASWWLEVHARGDRALIEGAVGKEGEAALMRRLWKRRPTRSQRHRLLRDESHVRVTRVKLRDFNS
jgi:hypothetical protein